MANAPPTGKWPNNVVDFVGQYPLGDSLGVRAMTTKPCRHLRLNQVPEDPHTEEWLEEMRPMLAAWVERGLRSGVPECQYAACMMAADLIPYIGESLANRMRKAARPVINILLASCPSWDHESRISTFLLRTRIG
jgi:hypothetical protein